MLRKQFPMFTSHRLRPTNEFTLRISNLEKHRLVEIENSNCMFTSINPNTKWHIHTSANTPCMPLSTVGRAISEASSFFVTSKFWIGFADRFITFQADNIKFAWGTWIKLNWILLLLRDLDSSEAFQRAHTSLCRLNKEQSTLCSIFAVACTAVNRAPARLEHTLLIVKWTHTAHCWVWSNCI
jgi:hypothetical protein